jgi:uncharacterized protein (TIRG00374 family)
MIRTWALRLVGPALFVYLLSTSDLGKIINTLVKARPWPLALGLLLTWLPILLRYLRWRRLNQGLGLHIPLARELAVHVACVAIGLVTPGRAGEFAKIHFLKQHSPSSSRAFASVAVDRVLDLAWLVMAGAACLAIHWGRTADLSPSLIAVWAGVGVAAAALGLWLALVLARSAGRRLAGRQAAQTLGGRLWDWAAQAWAAAQEYKLRDWAGAAVLTVLAWMGQLVQGYFYLAALGLEVGLADLAITLTLAALASIMPVSIAGIGSRDLALVYFLGVAGISSSGALAFSACILLSVLFTLAGGGAATLSGRTQTPGSSPKPG